MGKLFKEFFDIDSVSLNISADDSSFDNTGTNMIL